jgi:glycosyltransferase involved in cell wall biosynthesis
MKVTIITVVFNSVNTINRAIDSVFNQTYNNIEYIIIDGQSIDGTVEVITKYNEKRNFIFISEKDNGLYDAMNKGIRIATGDIVGILNSDDFFSNNNVISEIVNNFLNHSVDAFIGDVVFVSKNDLNKTIRYYSSSKWNASKFQYGYMPAHPSFFVKRELFLKYGLYNTEFKIASDFELMIRFFYCNKINYIYKPIVITKMLLGGASTSGLKSLIKLNTEILIACKKNLIKTNIFKIYSKYLTKLFEYI